VRVRLATRASSDPQLLRGSGMALRMPRSAEMTPMLEKDGFHFNQLHRFMSKNVNFLDSKIGSTI
jgi:hypothetical protein